MRENFKDPRVGRATLVERERATLAKAKNVRSRCVRPVLVNGPIVVVRWIFGHLNLFSLRVASERKDAAVGHVLRGLYIALAIISLAAIQSTRSLAWAPVRLAEGRPHDRPFPSARVALRSS